MEKNWIGRKTTSRISQWPHTQKKNPVKITLCQETNPTTEMRKHPEDEAVPFLQENKHLGNWKEDFASSLVIKAHWFWPRDHRGNLKEKMWSFPPSLWLTKLHWTEKGSPSSFSKRRQFTICKFLLSTQGKTRLKKKRKKTKHTIKNKTTKTEEIVSRELRDKIPLVLQEVKAEGLQLLICRPNNLGERRIKVSF